MSKKLSERQQKVLAFLEDFIDEADQALYKSKENGRNRITLFKPMTKGFEEIT